MNYQSLENQQAQIDSDNHSADSAQSLKSNDSYRVAVNPDGTLMKGKVRMFSNCLKLIFI